MVRDSRFKQGERPSYVDFFQFADQRGPAEPGQVAIRIYLSDFQTTGIS